MLNTFQYHSIFHALIFIYFRITLISLLSSLPYVHLACKIIFSRKPVRGAYKRPGDYRMWGDFFVLFFVAIGLSVCACPPSVAASPRWVLTGRTLRLSFKLPISVVRTGAHNFDCPFLRRLAWRNLSDNQDGITFYFFDFHPHPPALPPAILNPSQYHAPSSCIYSFTLFSHTPVCRHRACRQPCHWRGSDIGCRYRLGQSYQQSGRTSYC
jgi:hypothetical protein